MKVFDTSAFLNRVFFKDVAQVVTTNSVLNEIKNREQKHQIENQIQKGKVSIKDPSKQTAEFIKKRAPKALSKTDIDVIALAFELKAELHTDDFMMRKYASDLGITVKPVFYDLKNKDNEDLLEEVYNTIKPTKEELKQIQKISKKIIAKLNKTIKKEKIPVKRVILAGSSARGTFIRNEKDIDIFLLFDPKLSVEEIKEYNKYILKKTFPKTKFREEYGEHPYLKAIINDHNMDFVPGFYIKNIKDRKSSVDRTPFHLRFLQKHQNKNIKKQVILLKQFLKNNLLYGADQKNNGFSGYLTELLILKFKTFENVLKELYNIEKNRYLFIKEPKIKKRFDDFFVFVDPVDESRNAASALSKKNLQIFRMLAENYLSKPDKRFFFDDCYKNVLPKKIICFELKVNGKTEDTCWGIIKGLARKLSNELNSKHYAITNYSGLFLNKKGFILIRSELKDTMRGPEIKDTKNSKAFRRKHKKVYVRNNRLYCDIKISKRKLILEAKKILKKLNKNCAPKLCDLKILESKDVLKRVKKDFM